MTRPCNVTCIQCNWYGDFARQNKLNQVTRCWITAYFQCTTPWSRAPLCVLETGTASTRWEVSRCRCAAYFQRTSPCSQAPLCVLGDRYSEYEMRSFPAVAAPSTSSVQSPGPEHHYACLETGTASTKWEVPHHRGDSYFQRTIPWSRAPLCVLRDRYSEYEMRSPPPCDAFYFQRTIPWSRAPLCVLGDRYSEYEMRRSLPWISPNNLKTRWPILTFPRGNSRLVPSLHKSCLPISTPQDRTNNDRAHRIRPPSGATRTSIGCLIKERKHGPGKRALQTLPFVIRCHAGAISRCCPCSFHMEVGFVNKQSCTSICLLHRSCQHTSIFWCNAH